MINDDGDLRCKKLNDIQTGDVIFVKGKNGLIDTIIRFLTGSRYIHTAILIEVRGLWFIIETRNSSYYGYQMVPLEWWLARHHQDETFLAKKPISSPRINSNIKKVLMNSVESLRPYKISWILLTYIFQVWFGVFRPNFNKLYNGAKPLICSTLIQEAWERAGVIEPTDYMTPGGLIDYIGGESLLIPFGHYESSQSSISNPNNESNQHDLVAI